MRIRAAPRQCPAEPRVLGWPVRLALRMGVGGGLSCSLQRVHAPAAVVRAFRQCGVVQRLGEIQVRGLEEAQHKAVREQPECVRQPGRSKLQIIVLLIMIPLILGLIRAAPSFGVDLSQLATEYKCIKDSNKTFVAIRAYRSYGAIDPNIMANLQKANQAGLQTDIYMFPCRGKSAQAQVDELVKAVSQPLQQRNLREQAKPLYGTIWLDIESNPSANCSWSSFSFESNCQYIAELVRALVGHGKNPGMYASAHMWQEILGSKTACPNFTKLPLWYPHYDKDPSFKDWPTSQFGGWTKPSIKQYQGTTVLCNTGVDLNFRE